MSILLPLKESIQDERIYRYDELDVILAEVRKHFRFSRTKEGISYFNVPCAFDIETSSFYAGEEKKAITYAWAFGIFGKVIIGRTWEEFMSLTDALEKQLQLDAEHVLIVYVHNLAYDFQFFRKWLIWEKVFSVKLRKPIYAKSTKGIEFRCSYLLTGYKLSKVGENLHTFNFEKLVDNMDYALLRHSSTPLTDKEIGYMKNDVMIVMAHIAECLEDEKEISRLPLTKTGYVRRFIREYCINNKNPFIRMKYKDLIKSLTLTVEDYELLKRGFQGGFTHANSFCVNKTIKKVTSFDLISSYPSVIASEMFPMSPAIRERPTTLKEFNEWISSYCCMFEIELFDVETINWTDHYISISKCTEVKNAIVDNGRIVSASHLKTVMCELDYKIFCIMYTHDAERMAIGEFIRFKKDYIPKEFIEAMLKIYAQKTELKGVEEKEVEYMAVKELLNAFYGMTVTDIIHEQNAYADDWQPNEEYTHEEKCKLIAKYNASPSRFMFYPWGVWVTAYARYNLFTAITHIGADYCYSDTDSVKIKNAASHSDYFNRYNGTISAKIHEMLDFYKLPVSLALPKTIKGEIKQLGAWENECTYDRFKTLGAKRYMVEHDGIKELTVSGINKKIGMKYLEDEYGEEVFNKFDHGLYVPKGKTGRQTMTYVDEEIEGDVCDYMGIKGHYKELTFVHAEESDYSLSLAQEFLDYIAELDYED